MILEGNLNGDGLSSLNIQRTGCLISSPSHGSMLALSEDMELVNGQFMASWLVTKASEENDFSECLALNKFVN